ncbi:hypothetical protein I4U23_005883 [Adineta vaga]|nr:hypothetical protein I4U23_005883 [Adineta vaga]
MPYVYIRSLLIYDYKIENIEKEFLQYLQIYCPQAFQCIIYDYSNGRIIPNENQQKIFSNESRLTESISKYLNNNTFIDNLFPYDSIPTDISPLIFLHQIHFNDGTILIFGCHHLFSDGHGFSLLGQRFSLWLKKIKANFFDHDRSKLNHIAISSSIEFDHPEMSIIEPIYSLMNFSSTQTIIQRFTKESLFNKLKITNQKLSTNDILVGWLTQIISRIRQLPSETIVKVGMALNGRMFLPNINEDYFGNCSFYVCLSFPMIDLLNQTVNQLAERIHIDKRKFMTQEYIQSALAFINKYHQQSMIHLGWQAYGGVDLSFTNWSHFPLYQCDFGQGNAKIFRIPSIQFDGLIFILPTINNNEIELHISLKHSHAQELLSHLQ